MGRDKKDKKKKKKSRRQSDSDSDNSDGKRTQEISYEEELEKLKEERRYMLQRVSILVGHTA